MKIILDSNIYISAIGFKSKVLQDFILMCLENFDIVICDELVGEVSQNLSNKCQIEVLDSEIWKQLAQSCVTYKLNEHEIYSRDTKDGYLLSLIKVSGSAYLITGDKDLLDLAVFQGAKIMKARAFVEMIGAI